MLGHRALTMQDYVVILKRRWWIIAIPAIIFPIVGYAITFLVRPQYVSQTLVLVEQQKVPEHYVLPNVAADLQQRLESMTQQILSRTRLLNIIDQLHLYSGERARLGPDELVERMRKDIKIDLVQAAGGRQLNYQALHGKQLRIRPPQYRLHYRRGKLCRQ